MAEMIDEPQLTEEEESQISPLVEEEAVEEEEQPTLEAAEEEATPDEDDGLPEKYRGKSKAEIARMHEEAQQALGRQSSEVGELRKVFDEYVQSSIQSQQAAPVEEEPVDFLLEPEKAVQRAIDNHPKLKQAEALIAQTAKQQNMSRLQSDFPDLQETLGNPKFREWVEASPIRQRLYADADANFDYDSAAELLTNWKDRNMAVKRTLEVEKKEQKRAVTRASSGNTRSNPDNKAPKKIYRRADIIKLMKEDPARYEQLQDEIMLAYAEKRVR